MFSNHKSSHWQSIGAFILVSALGAIGLWAGWPKLAEPLCKLETFTSTYSLQTLGYPAIAEGNEIVLGTQRIDVASSCGGIRMLVSIFVMSVAVATFVKRPLWERSVIVVSSLPIAVMCNVVRVTVMSALNHQMIHDLTGWLMMPLALSVFGIELWIFSRLLIAPPDRDVVPVGSRREMSTAANRSPRSFGELGGISPRRYENPGDVRSLTAAGSPALSQLELVTQR